MLTRIVVADDHPAVRSMIRRILHQDPGLLVVAEAQDGCRAVDLATYFAPDVVLMDLSMPVLDGIEATRQLLAEDAGHRVIAMSMHADEEIVLQALRAGAAGFLVKEAAGRELPEAIRTVREGGMFISHKVKAELGSRLEDAVRRRGSRDAGAAEDATAAPARPDLPGSGMAWVPGRASPFPAAGA